VGYVTAEDQREHAGVTHHLQAEDGEKMLGAETPTALGFAVRLDQVSGRVCYCSMNARQFWRLTRKASTMPASS
jgi:hypothetical protein